MASLEYRHFTAAYADAAWRWSSFSPREMADRASGKLKVDVNFMDKLQAIRNAYGKPIIIVSGYRTPEHNAAVSQNQSMTGAHTHGRAVDISLAGGVIDVPLMLSFAWTFGMTRCGLELSSERWRFHLDDMTDQEGFAVREDARGMLCWTY